MGHCVRGVDGMQPDFPCMALFTSHDRYAKFKFAPGRHAAGVESWQDRRLHAQTLHTQLLKNASLLGIVVNPEPGNDAFTSSSFTFLPKATLLKIFTVAFDT